MTADIKRGQYLYHVARGLYEVEMQKKGDVWRLFCELDKFETSAWIERAVLSAIDSERKEAVIEQYQAALRSVNAVAIERGDKYGACDQIDNDGKHYQSQWLTDLLAVSDSPASAIAASKSIEGAKP
jgi:hypothetical protein